MKKFNITVNGKSYEVDVEEIGGIPTAPAAPRAAAPVAPRAAAPKAAAKTAPKAAASGNGTNITAPMPGTIFKMVVSKGDVIAAGDVVLVLEAMKMENEISSPVAGTVTSVTVKEGDSVNGGDVLVVIG